MKRHSVNEMNCLRSSGGSGSRKPQRRQTRSGLLALGLLVGLSSLSAGCLIRETQTTREIPVPIEPSPCLLPKLPPQPPIAPTVCGALVCLTPADFSTLRVWLDSVVEWSQLAQNCPGVVLE